MGHRQEGGRRDPVSLPRDKIELEQTEEDEEEDKTDRRRRRCLKNRKAPRPIANHPGPRSSMDLDPGVEMQWAGGPPAYHNRGEVRNKNPGRSIQTARIHTHNRHKKKTIIKKG